MSRDTCRVVPTNGEKHGGADCWCQPALMQVCPECLDTGEPSSGPDDVRHPDPDCWRCGGDGAVDEYDPDRPLVIVHNSVDEILETLP